MMRRDESILGRLSQTEAMRAISLMRYALCALCVSANALTAHAAESAHADTGASLSGAAAELAPVHLLRLGTTPSFYSPFAFLVDKKARTLSVWKQEMEGWRKLASYPADLGKKEGVKTKRNDHRTPEGIYFLDQKLEGAGLDFNLYGARAFTTNYPNFFDRLEGKTGSGIWLHAVPDQTPLTRGSRGCVVVRNDAIIELSKYVDLGRTPMVIAERVEYVKPSEIAQRANEIEASLERWRQAWETKDIEAYISFYGEGFRAQKMDRADWKAYKARLNESYRQLSIKLSKPYIVAYRDRAVARFMQSYASDQHQDFGEKTLYLHKEGGTFKIVGEDWAAESSRLAREAISSDGALAPEAATASACGPDSPCPQKSAAKN